MNGGPVKLREKLRGRVEMCLNTANLHTDEHVRHDSRIRAQAYMNAEEDAERDDECNALVELWKAVDYAEKNGALENQAHRPIVEALRALDRVWTGKD